jgi:exo-beta-1,3-glucanase (GH17 family)
LAKAYPGIVQVVSVGNETMVEWSSLKGPVADMVAYLQQVRAAVSQPVTTDDDWAFYANKDEAYQPRPVLEAIDFVSLHLYPILDSVYDPSFTEWKHADIPASRRATAMMDTMFARARSHFEAVRSYVASQSLNLPLVIGEAGWKARITNGESGRAHPVNQKMYVDWLQAWRNGPAQIFYFEAFDEPWKGGDDGWGLFNVERQARHVIAPLFPAAQRETPNYSAGDAVYFQATAGNAAQ